MQNLNLFQFCTCNLSRIQTVEEHMKLICRIQSEYGSLTKASASLNVPWKTFHRLCQKYRKENGKGTMGRH